MRIISVFVLACGIEPQLQDSESCVLSIKRRELIYSLCESENEYEREDKPSLLERQEEVIKHRTR